MTAVASLASCRAMARGTGPSKRSNRPSSRALGNSALNTRGIARGERGTRGKSSRVASRATSNEDDEPPAPEPLLVIVEVDGVLCDVHCDLHRLAFNEAFAAVAVASMADLGVPDDIVNVNGGAIALGHPIGMSGARIAIHLAYELRRRGGGIGVAALCGGGGQGDALVIKVDGRS